MTAQLLLLAPAYDDFRLDERTREIGREGIAAARRALAEAAGRSASSTDERRVA